MINKIISTICLTSASLLFFACTEEYKNRDFVGESFPEVNGIALDEKRWQLPQAWSGQQTLALLGYVQDSQFDIDRWLIGLDMRSVNVKVYELPTIKGMIPRMISERINEGMRSGIPDELWGGVITLYSDGDRLQRFTGNERPRNARVILVDDRGIVRFFTDRGFSVPSLNKLISTLQSTEKSTEKNSDKQPLNKSAP
jgi:hypothetical protein